MPPKEWRTSAPSSTTKSDFAADPSIATHREFQKVSLGGFAPAAGIASTRDTKPGSRRPSLTRGAQTSRVAQLAWNSVPGYAGHVPGKESENIHGLCSGPCKEHSLAEHTALRRGAQPQHPWFPWATSSGKYPGALPSWRTSRNTLDKTTKPHRVYAEEFHGVGVGDRLALPVQVERHPAGSKCRWAGSWMPGSPQFDVRRAEQVA